MSLPFAIKNHPRPGPKQFILSLAFATLAGATARADPPAAANANARPVLAVYLPDYRVEEDTTPRLFGASHLILFAAEPREDGSVDFDRIDANLLAFARKARSADPALKVTVCIGGWGRGKFFAGAVGTAESRRRFIADLVVFCDRHRLDGIDIDWEFPKGEREHADFALFLAGLSEKLHASGRLLTVALGYTRPLPAECWPHIDYVNLMSYQPWSAGEKSYEAWLAASIERFLAAGLPPDKLLLGVGFFAKEKAGDRRAISWKSLVGTDSTGLPASDHGFWPVGVDACDLRIRLVKKYGLGGIMVWDYGHDSPLPDRSLLRHLSAGLDRSTAE